MKEVVVVCPNCGSYNRFPNWFSWVWHNPFHWFGKRKVKCTNCANKFYMERVK